MCKLVNCTKKQLNHYKILDLVCQKYDIPINKVTWDNGCYRLPDYNKPDFDLFPEDIERFNHVLLKKGLGSKQQDLDPYLREITERHNKQFLNKYLKADSHLNILTVGHLIACSLVPYAEGAYAYFSKDLPLSVKKHHQLSNVVPETAWCNGIAQNTFEGIVHAFIQEHDDFDSIEYKVTPIYLNANPDHQLPIMICMQAKIHPGNLQFPDLDSHNFSVLIPNTQVGIPTLDYGFAKLKFKKK